MIVKKVKPMFTTVITTANKYGDEKTDGTLITKIKGTLKEYQTVIAVGTSVRDIKVGDVVMINPTRYAVKKHQAGSLKDGVITDNPVIGYNFNIVSIDGKDCLKIQDSDVDFIIEDYEEEEEVEDTSRGDKLLLPRDKKLILPS